MKSTSVAKNHNIPKQIQRLKRRNLNDYEYLQTKV